MENKNIDELLARKIENGREYRRIQIEDIEIREAQGDEMIVEGYATKFGVPYTLWAYDDYQVDEQIDARAFDECDMSDTIMQYDHCGRVFARVSNKTLELTVDSVGLRVRANLGGTEIGRQLYEEIKGGYTSKMSFGFVVAEDTRTVTEDHEAGKTFVMRTITRIKKLYDVSAVSFPANDATEISARAYADGVIDEARKEIAAAEKRKQQIAKIKLLCNI